MNHSKLSSPPSLTSISRCNHGPLASNPCRTHTSSGVSSQKRAPLSRRRRSTKCPCGRMHTLVNSVLTATKLVRVRLDSERISIYHANEDRHPTSRLVGKPEMTNI